MAMPCFSCKSRFRFQFQIQKPNSADMSHSKDEPIEIYKNNIHGHDYELFIFEGPEYLPSTVRYTCYLENYSGMGRYMVSGLLSMLFIESEGKDKAYHIAAVNAWREMCAELSKLSLEPRPTPESPEKPNPYAGRLKKF